jgi:hypothetical protein
MYMTVLDPWLDLRVGRVEGVGERVVRVQLVALGIDQRGDPRRRQAEPPGRAAGLPQPAEHKMRAVGSHRRPRSSL